MTPDKFAVYFADAKARAKALAERPSKYLITGYRGFLDRQIKYKTFTPDQVEQLQELIALMVERYNERTAALSPDDATRRRNTVYSRNDNGLKLASREDWSARKENRWHAIEGDWHSTKGLLVPSAQVGREVEAAILAHDAENPDPLKAALKQRRHELRENGQINEAFRQWSDWLAEVVDNLAQRQRFEPMRKAKAAAKAAAKIQRQPRQQQTPPPPL